MNGFEVVLVSLVAAAVGALAVAAAIRRSAGASGIEAQLGRLADAVNRQAADDAALRDAVAGTRQAVEELRVRDEERRRRDETARDALERLERAFLGASSRGRGGENVVWEALSALPPDMVDAGFRVGGKVVEFSLRLPDGRRLPVDSKWPGAAELEAMEAADGEDRRRLAQAVERVVAARAREVAKYLDPAATTPFAVAAIPDAAYHVLRRAHLDAFAAGVLLVPYTSALPTLLALYALCCRMGGDATDVGALVMVLSGALDGIESVVENKVERAGKMSQTAAADIRVHLGRARQAVSQARAGASITELSPPRLVEVDRPAETAPQRW
jgi:DNA recombination protein RmuC